MWRRTLPCAVKTKKKKPCFLTTRGGGGGGPFFGFLPSNLVLSGTGTGALVGETGVHWDTGSIGTPPLVENLQHTEPFWKLGNPHCTRALEQRRLCSTKPEKGGRVKTTFRPFIVNLRLCILNHLTMWHSEPVMT